MTSSAHILSDGTQPHGDARPFITSTSEIPSSRARFTYCTRLATTEADIQATQRLRFSVFDVELQEGLHESWRTQLDFDRFDSACDHLVIEHIDSGKIVGTYRVQTGEMAAAANGYYSEQEFDFTPFEPFRGEMVELGRACVHRDPRKGNVLDLLWRGIAAYSRAISAPMRATRFMTRRRGVWSSAGSNTTSPRHDEKSCARNCRVLLPSAWHLDSDWKRQYIDGVVRFANS